MNKIYQHNNNSNRSNGAQGSAGAGANTARVGPQQNAVTTPTPQQPTNVPNNSNHGHHHHQQQHHHPRQHGHNPHQHHHHHHQQQSHHQHQQPHQQQHSQQQQQHHHQHHQQQQTPQQQQQQPQPQHQPQSQQQPPQLQQQHHHQNPHHHPQNPSYVPHPTGPHMSHDVIETQHHHPQQPPPPQQVQQGPGVQPPGAAQQQQPPPPAPQQQQQPSQQQQPQANQQHNPVVKHHSQQPHQTSMANSQVHQAHHHQHHHHNHQQHNQQHHHPLHHQPQMPISPSMPQQQWVGPPPPQAQSSQAQHHQQSAQHHQQHAQPQQPQQPHHMTHPPAPQMMINQQYPNPNFLYSQMGHAFVPPTGHVPQYDHPPAASHQPDPVNINSQQQPVSISNHHPGNMPLTQIQTPTVISTATTGTTNVHQMNNGPMMDAHMSNRLPLNHQQPYMLPNPYMQGPFNLMVPYPLTNLNAYPGGPHMPPPNPAMISPIRVTSDMSIRQQYDPQNQTTALPTTAALSQPPPSGAKPPVPVPPTSGMAVAGAPLPSIKPRERKVLAIVDPRTKHVFTVDELKGSAKTPQSQSSSKDPPPVTSGISPKEPSISEKDSTSEEPVVKSASSDSTAPSDTPTQAPKESSQVQEVSSQESKPESGDKQEQRLKEEEVERQPSPSPPPPPPTTTTSSSSSSTITEEKVTENGEAESKIEEEEEARDEVDLTAEVAKLSISADDKPSDVPEEEPKDETPVKKPALPNLPYAAGQFSPLNPNGSKKYSIEFLKAVAKEMNIELDTSSAHNHRIDFVPHYVNQSPGGNFRNDYSSSSQPLMRRSSQQVINKPRKIITITHSLQQEVELKTAEKPWKPELETEKSKIVEIGEMDTKRLLKVFRGHLNKLTPQKYDSLIEKIGALDLNGSERLNSVIDLVFDKAVDEPGFCELYARMCKVIAAKDSNFCFHLVKKCQEEFETSDLYDGLNVEERKLKIEQEPDPAKKKTITDELYEDMRLRRKKYLGTIKLIGEMYKLGLLSPKIIGLCMNHLIEEASNENIECLCSLITTVGSRMALEPEEGIKMSLKNTLNVLQEFAHSKKTNELFTLESRIKFKILDTIDLSRRNWRPRMVENNPKKIEEIREEAKEELLRQQHHNHSSQTKRDNLVKTDDRDRARRVGSLYNTFKGATQKW